MEPAAKTDEPTFVLRASDPMAPILIRLWAAQKWQEHADPEMIDEARAVADAMDAWRREHGR